MRVAVSNKCTALIPNKTSQKKTTKQNKTKQKHLLICLCHASEEIGRVGGVARKGLVQQSAERDVVQRLLTLKMHSSCKNKQFVIFVCLLFFVFVCSNRAGV
jgi:hypothetical protein